MIENKILIKKNYEVRYQFKTESDYSLNISFDDQKNQLSKMQLWIDTNKPDVATVFSCGDQQEPLCDNISLEINHKTGNSNIIFNQAKIYDYNKKILNLSGSISGQLQQDPAVVTIPASSVYDATYRISDNN